MHLKTQLDKKSRLILLQQNQIRTNFNTLRKKVDPDRIAELESKSPEKEKKKDKKSRKSSKKVVK